MCGELFRIMIVFLATFLTQLNPSCSTKGVGGREVFSVWGIIRELAKPFEKKMVKLLCKVWAIFYTHPLCY